MTDDELKYYLKVLNQSGRFGEGEEGSGKVRNIPRINIRRCTPQSPIGLYTSIYPMGFWFGQL